MLPNKLLFLLPFSLHCHCAFLEEGNDNLGTAIKELLLTKSKSSPPSLDLISMLQAPAILQVSVQSVDATVRKYLDVVKEWSVNQLLYS
jgi:hypothetical protein